MACGGSASWALFGRCQGRPLIWSGAFVVGRDYQISCGVWDWDSPSLPDGPTVEHWQVRDWLISVGV